MEVDLSKLPVLVGAALDSQLFWEIISLILGAVALSGKLSMSASNVLLALAWIIGCFGIYRAGVFSNWHVLVGVWLAFGSVLAFLAAWLQPSLPKVPEEVSQRNEIKSLLGEVQDPDYRDLVAEVIQSFDPEAHIAVGNAIDGPDGFRKVDVEVRSSDSRLVVVDIISRPDGRKVGIEAVDQADSKRMDIKADAMLICSNTGFDKMAIRKAKRLRIGLIAVAKQGDQRIKATIQEEVYLRKVNVTAVTTTWDGATDADGDLLHKYFKDGHAVTFNGWSVTSWLMLKAAEAVMLNPTIQDPLVATFHLKTPTRFSVQGHPVALRALTIRFHPHTQWLSQVVELDAKSAVYNYIRGRFALSPGPNKIIMKGINFDTATPMASPPPVTDLGFGLLPGEVDVELMRVCGLDIPKGAESTIPKLDDLIKPEDLSLKMSGVPPKETRSEDLAR